MEGGNLRALRQARSCLSTLEHPPPPPGGTVIFGTTLLWRRKRQVTKVGAHCVWEDTESWSVHDVLLPVRALCFGVHALVITIGSHGHRANTNQIL